MKRIYQTIIIVAALACIIPFEYCGRLEQAKRETLNRTIPVSVKTVKHGSIEKKIDFLGNIQAFYNVNVYSTIPTKIISMKLKAHI